MKIRYSRDEDILIIELSDEKIEYAEEAGPIIVHFSGKRKPVLLEILDASEFLTEAMKLTMKLKDEKPVDMKI